MATLVKVPTPAKQLKAGDVIHLLGLVIAVEQRFDKIRVTFKGSGERIYPATQVVTLLATVAPPEATLFGVL